MVDKIRIGMIALILVAGVSGGVSLARFATGGIAVASSADADKPYMPDNSASYWDNANAASAPAAQTDNPQVASAADSDAMPQHYDCTGCGPTLAQRRADYGAGTGGPTDNGPPLEAGTIQPYAPMPYASDGPSEGHPGPH
jgi:hypothetical protein